MEFFETARCINSYVKSIYKYNTTDDSINLSLEELIQKGGDCRDWSNFYETAFNRFGYNTQRVRLHVEDNVYHVFVVASNDEGYVFVDQTKIFEFRYG